ncbi:MAG TPA: FecR family protein [Bryobacteraceae bacterium]|nr:FecR family protein [Bryobacteraceae bacterium]
MRLALDNPAARLAFAGLALLLAQPLAAQLNTAPKPALQDGAARLAALEGAVSIQKAGGLWALNVGDVIQVQQVVVTGADGYARFEVADGSTFEVFPSSKVTFRNNPGDWRDLVDVWLGRIRVHIQKLGGMPNPNRVQTPTAIISVRGTVFDVAVTDDDETTTVAVAEGQVAVTHRLMHREGGVKLLNAGDEITVYRNVPLSAGRKMDRTRAAQYAGEALWQIMLRGPRIGGGSGGSTPTAGTPTPPATQPLPGDTESTPPPPPPPGGGE